MKRSQIRELAMQSLCSMDMQEEFSLEQALFFWEYLGHKESDSSFFQEIIKGYIENQSEIDDLIKKVSKNWSMKRMPYVDKNIIRIATFEILYKDDIPPNVSINEAVNIAKKFGTNNSGSFVNGILDKISNIASDKEV